MSKTKSDNSDSVARVYAQALVDVAEASQALDETRQQLDELGSLLADHEGLLAALSSTIVSSQERDKSIETIFKGRVSDLVLRFLQVVNEKDRLGVLPAMIRAYGSLLDERKGMVEADLFVAAQLSQQQVSSIGDRLNERIGKQVVLHQHVDPGLIGGLRVRVGDRLLDGTVSAQLRLMRDVLVDAGRQRVRTDTDKHIQG